MSLAKPGAVDNMLSSVEVDFGDLSAFVIEWPGTNREWSKIIYDQKLYETLRKNYPNVAVGNWNSNWLNILKWESGRQLNFATRFTRIGLVKQDFCGAMTLTYFTKNCLISLNGI